MEDQQKINRFANLNAKLEDLKEDLKIRKNELTNIEEAIDEIELADDTDDNKIPFLIGEVFVLNSVTKTQELLQETREKKIKEIKEIEVKSKDIQDKMSDLKSQLYVRFGKNIYLENDD